MGRTTRDGSYYKKIIIGRRTIKDGECCGIWKLNGKQKLVSGPRLIWVYFSRINFLTNFFADQNQYLVVVKNDGSVDHIRGPTSLFLNPLEHQSIKVANAIRLGSGESLVIIKVIDNINIERRIVLGPTLLFLEPNETEMVFSWHGLDPKKKDDIRYQPNKNKFSKLSTGKQQMYYNVENVRTSDNAIITLKLLIGFQLKKTELMLEKTEDPIREFIASIQRDVIEYFSSLTFEDFLSKTERFNTISSYPSLIKTAKSIGFIINGVVYRGYEASKTVQLTHDSSLHQRSLLREELDNKKQNLEIEYRLMENKLENLNRQHESQTQQIKHSLKLNEQSHLADLSRKKLEIEMRLDSVEANYNAELEFVNQLFKRKINVTDALCSNFQSRDCNVRVVGNDSYGFGNFLLDD
eukprot:c18385_g1_i1.p1 GENE.c18385_g1_i1~~c18385_g1_i1.p1  ORF type:complete len:409 (+),score=110.05 c18385_g1_i1:3-1229(+)